MAGARVSFVHVLNVSSESPSGKIATGKWCYAFNCEMSYLHSHVPLRACFKKQTGALGLGITLNNVALKACLRNKLRALDLGNTLKLTFSDIYMTTCSQVCKYWSLIDAHNLCEHHCCRISCV